MGGVVKVLNPVEHVKAVTRVADTVISHTPLPPIVKEVATTVTHITAAQAESVLQHPVKIIEKTVETVKHPTLENLVATVPSDPLGVTSSPAQLVEDVRQLTSASNLQEFLEKSSQIAVKEIMKTTQTMQPIYTCVTFHWNSMKDQATSESKWKKLSQTLIDRYREHYSINLEEVRYAENINTKVENTAIAFPGEVFFPRLINPENNQQDLHWILHELTHLEQYKRVGGLHPYLDQYSSDIVVKVITRQTFSPHDLLEYEKEADEKADRLCGLLLSNNKFRI
jgi:hypothetical protein